MKVLFFLWKQYKDQVPDGRFWNMDDFFTWVMENYTPEELDELENTK